MLDTAVSFEEEFDPFAAGALERVIPTTEAQREVWLADRLSPQASLAYNESMDLRLDGPLDVDALRAAMERVVARHDALRASFSADGMQLMIAQAGPFEMALHDLGSRDAAVELAAARIEAVEAPFDLENGPLFRAALYRLSPQQHVLMMTGHHAVCDGWSWGVICEDLGRLYAEQRGAGPGLEPATSYADYANWESAEAGSLDMQGHLAFWLERFSGSNLPVLELPLDRPRAPLRSFASRRIDEQLSAPLVDAVRKLGARSGASLFATLFSVFAATVHRLSQQDDLVIGVPAAGQSVSNMPRVVGHCVNLLPIRVAVDAQMPLESLIRQSASTLLDAFEHQTLTYGSLLKKLPLPRDPSRPSLVSIMINLDRDPGSDADLFPGLQAQAAANPRRFENFELFLNVVPTDAGLRLELQYGTALFDETTVRRWLRLFRAALERFVEQPALPVASALAPTAEDTALLDSFNATTASFDTQVRIDALIARQAETTPDACALIAGETRMSYRELDQRANALAQALRARGVSPGQLVGLCCARDAQMLVALLGILKSGAGYVPLDPSFPRERLDFMAEDAGLRLVVADATTAPSWEAGAAAVVRVDTLAPEATAPTPVGSAEDVAYVIYTSGSTGRPKGVRVPHRTVVNLLASLRSTPGITAAHTTLAVTTLSFDIAVSEVIMPLTVGACVVVADKAQAMDGGGLRALIERHQVRFIDATPSTWRLLLEAEWPGSADLLAVCTGEPLPADLATLLLPRVGQLWNGYGPTETTVWSSFHRVTTVDAPVPIGRPVANTAFHVLDPQRQPLPVGVTGELYIAGSGVTLGYLNRPELTDERFVAASGDPGQRWYRTGDLGRWRSDGVLECLGRADHQVKVRGYRIELGEIESNLAHHPAVERALVVTREDSPGDVRIVAYVVPNGPMPEAAALRQHLAAFLPEYMLPQHYVALENFPLLPNGKTDRKALPAPQGLSAAGAAARVAPRNARETRVLEAMEKVLSLPGIGIHDDFFALGGHSLLAARLTTLLGREFDIVVPLRTLFEAPTVERLTAAIDSMSGTGAPRREAIAHLPGRRVAPLTPMQERIRFLEELHPGRSTYNAPSAHRLGGALDLEKFRSAFATIIERQPTLRTSMGIDPASGKPVALIAEQLDYQLPVVDLGGLPAEQAEAALREHMREMADRSIDIHRGPLFNATLFRMAADDHVFVFVPHHVVWDGWSFDILQAELSTIYGALVRGEPHGLSALEVTHGDYAAWYARWLDTPEAAAQLHFWKERFANSPMPKALRTDMPRRAGMSGLGSSQGIRLDQALSERLRELGRRHDLSLNMLTLGVFILMVSSIARSPSIVIATPTRVREAPELESVMGFFNNLLPLSFQVDATTSFGEFLRYVKAEFLSVTSYQQIPFERLVNEPEFAERAQGNGLYQALFSFQDARERPSAIGELADRQLPLTQSGATDDLGIWLMDKVSGLEGAVIYNADIYLGETGAAFKERYVELLQRVVDHPEQTLGEIVAPVDSPSALYLQRLASDSEAPATAVAAAAETVRPAAQQSLLLPEQARLAQIWASALSIDVNDISANEVFFDLGGDSLLAMRVIQQAEQVMGFRVEPRRYVFETLGQLASAAAGTALEAPFETAVDAPVEAPVERDSRRGLLGRVFSGWGRKG